MADQNVQDQNGNVPKPQTPAQDEQAAQNRKPGSLDPDPNARKVANKATDKL